MNKFFKFFVALFVMSTLCFSFVSCGDDNDEPKTDEENYTLLCTAMIPHGLLKVGMVDFFALNPETGKESGFNLPDNYGNDWENSSFAAANDYLKKISFGNDPSKFFIRYIVVKGKSGQKYSMTATFKPFEKEKIAAMENQQESIECGTIILYPIALTPKGSFTAFDMSSSSSHQTITIASLVENYDHWKERWSKSTSISGTIK